MTNHRRDDEGTSYEHMREDDMPSWLRWLLFTIEKTGFAAVMCLLVWYSHETSEKNLVTALNQQSLALQTVINTDKDVVSQLQSAIVMMAANHSEAKEWREHFMAEFRGSRR